MMRFLIFHLLALLAVIQAMAQNDSDYADFACLPPYPVDGRPFQDQGNAVCIIH